ncbi:glucuronate isomerase [Caldanaerobius polysaccharolyticus]|uniref:glucuronate isomerase n=1 Tax=Caldanaerobius polysaccharolyticus TaxID=44256 RepID=UPI00054F83EF|nr:glucuronate isomerase [Caldanaerobius polysaccharolyticus]
MVLSEGEIKKTVYEAVENVEITDVHTHLYPPSFGNMLLWGIDELLNYHYLVAEAMRWADIPYQDFWAMSKREQADFIWKTLFVDNSPYSEACRGVLTNLHKLGFDVASRDLIKYRKYFDSVSLEEYVDRIFKEGRIKCVVMTNDPFNEEERGYWLKGLKDSRFKGALRLDVLLNNWPEACAKLRQWGYEVSEDFSGDTAGQIRKFLREWMDRIEAVYMAVSLPWDFAYPEDSPRSRIIEECVLPVAGELNKPFALMIGVKRQLNPGLKDAGDGVGRADVRAVEYLCSRYPHNKFMVTLLSRENQHELAVAARKFRNLMPFGCWWFLNNPSLVDEITRMRCELLGVSFIPQHSDARVLDQLIYKWEHSRKIIADVLVDKYTDLARTGWAIESQEVRRDVEKLFGGNFWGFLERKF